MYVFLGHHLRLVVGLTILRSCREHCDMIHHLAYGGTGTVEVMLGLLIE